MHNPNFENHKDNRIKELAKRTPPYQTWNIIMKKALAKHNLKLVTINHIQRLVKIKEGKILL